MKKDVVTRRFDPATDSEEQLVEMHRKIFEGTSLENKLIYYADNFLNYLRGAVRSLQNHFYLLEVDDNVVGFLHYKLFPDSVFVNNLYVSDVARGNGMGRLFFGLTLKNYEHLYQDVYLDVFHSNTKVVEWYNRLGFKENYRKTWMEYSLYENGVNRSEDFLQKKDENGFESVFYLGEKVATVVNRYLLVHDNIVFRYDYGYKFQMISNLSSEVEGSEYKKRINSTKELDVSLNLKGKTKEVLQHLLNK